MPADEVLLEGRGVDCFLLFFIWIFFGCYVSFLNDPLFFYSSLLVAFFF